MKLKQFFIFSFLVILICIFGYFFVLPPKVIETKPLNKTENVDLETSLVIKFNKPIKRKEIQYQIFPEVHGELKFENSLFKNHLFKNLVFIPALRMEANTSYILKIEKIKNAFFPWLKTDFVLSFKTGKPKIPQIKTGAIFLSQKEEKKITILNIKLDWQDHPLSCEAASLKMALKGKGIEVSEEEIMEKIGQDKTPHIGKVWGDPHKAYVGNIDGKICVSGFGVFWEPLARAANFWRPAEAFQNWKLEDLTKEIELGNPVIVWGALPTGKLTDCSWFTPEGKYIKAFKETHVRLVIGFIGDQKNPEKIILNDPLAGRLFWPTSFFMKNWEVFGFSGVVIR